MISLGKGKTRNYKLNIKFITKGTIIVKANSKLEAFDVASSSFGFVVSDIQAIDNRIVDWDISIHPQKLIGDEYASEL